MQSKIWKTKKADFETNLPYEDFCFLEHTDYYGELYNKEDRAKAIRSDWMKDLFDGFATLDTKAETITFLDEEAINKNYREYILQVTKSLYEKAQERKLDGYELRAAGDEYKGHDTLFYMVEEAFGRTSFDMFEDAVYHAGETYKIGNIFDAHI